MAHKKGAGSTSNGRESHSKRLGVKKFGGQAVIAGNGKPCTGDQLLQGSPGVLRTMDGRGVDPLELVGRGHDLQTGLAGKFRDGPYSRTTRKIKISLLGKGPAGEGDRRESHAEGHKRLVR